MTCLRSYRLLATRRARLLNRHRSHVPHVVTQLYLPVDFTTNAKIEGEESQIATIRLAPGERIRAESGSMLYMTQGVEMETSSSAGEGMKRFLTGQNIFITDFYYQGDKHGTVALGTRFPSKILRLNLQDYPEDKLICQKGAFLASNLEVNVEMEFTKNFQAGFFGGQGFVLQKLEGKGDVLLQAGGTLIRKDLKHGENVRISAGCLVAFSATVSYDVEMIPGFNNVVFGGEGLFVTTLKGPGIVWLQGMPSDRFISEIVRRVPVGGIGLGIPFPMGREGGGVATSPVDDSVVPENGTESVSAVATTDTAVEADRQATVATSGPMDSRSVDAESPNALFGDATPMSGLASQDGFSDVFSNEISSFDETKIDSSGIDSSDETTFSTDDALGTDFHDDNTSFSSLYGSDSVGNGIAEDVKSTTDRLLRKLWEMFNGEA